MLRFLVLADFKLFLDKRLYVSFFLSISHFIKSDLFLSNLQQIWSPTTGLPVIWLFIIWQLQIWSHSPLFDNQKSGLTRCHLPRSRVAPKLSDWGPEPRLYLRRMQPDTWWWRWYWYQIISTRWTLEVLFLDVKCFIYQRWLWYQLYVPGHFNQLRFNPKVASWSRHSRQKFYSPV